MRSYRAWAAGLLLAPLVACAAPGGTADHNGHSGAVPDSASRQAYARGMETMHGDMMKAIQSDDPDIAFAQGMIAHHQGAIDMAKTELKYGKDPAMRKLAQEIIAAQQPEIDRMQRWLAQHPAH
ncbi:DUF305 domain-containing protein [Chimaeribacter arupi]|uniref:DUF305 domain-containing protein n=2 Tax=Yersiniaceae TaxID=1903411 RepID=A0A2N5ESC3_9GAMM|nr:MULTISPECIES: DUF305 domain-containing protein [Yersiniaceae]MBS0970407.1 DUF305 domain-containing protein [Nissabacter archeti]MDV5138526.1 DUF305 domain-containing protein [Chimaeribacter arupi]PLR45519.1 DUF305 domain-containing protein [Chimaeribacter arupi]PLR50900.1 DUF305 domain-containing protein [Chimaeribacter arupi]PLR52751.1 DUF305 domain-containing protein [Chimaeribacter arupi]